MKKALKAAARGTIFPYAGEKWVALEHEASGRTLCLRLDLIPNKPFDENNCNNFATSSSKEWMNGPYLDNLIDAVKGPHAFLTTELDLTADDGLKDYHDMYADKQSDELLLKLNDTRELWDRWSPKKGDTIAVEDGAAKTGKMFVESVVPESGLITLRAYSAPQSTKDKRSKSWEKIKFLQLIQEIAGRHGLTVETYGITDQTYDYVEQNNLPDFAFLQARCTLEGAAFLVYDGKLVVYDEAYMEGQQPVDTITITPANNFEYRDEGAYAYGSAEAVNGGLTGTFSAPAGGDKVLRKILPFRMTDQAEADRFAKGLLRDANKEATVATLWTGTLLREYAAGSVVTLSTEGVASWDGTAFVSRIRHDYVKTRSKLYLRKPLEGY